MNRYHLFLDDIRFPIDCINYTTRYHRTSNYPLYIQLEWKIVRSYNEFVEEIETRFKNREFPTTVSFDHDLAGSHYDPENWENYDTWIDSDQLEEKTGFHCARWLVEFCIENKLQLPEVFIHSMNPIGSDKIYEQIRDYYRYLEKFPDAIQ